MEPLDKDKDGYEIEPWRDPKNPNHVVLDPETMDQWKQLEDHSERKPGPMNHWRYNITANHTGIPTFFKLPIAVTPEDLKAGGIEVAIFGAPYGSYMPGSGGGNVLGPMVVRSVRDMVIYSSPPIMGWSEFETGINAFAEMKMVDYGDINVDPWSPERSQEELRRVTREVAQAGAIPVVVGGDHAIPYGIIQAMNDAHGKGNYAVVHYDAHPDWSTKAYGHYVNNGAFGEMVRQGIVPGENLFHIGISSGSYGTQYYQHMLVNGSHLWTSTQIIKPGGVEKMHQELLKKFEKIYVTFDVDTFDVSYAPGTSSSEFTALTPNQLFPQMRRLAASKKLIALDVVEYNPTMDNQSKQTARLVRRIMFQFLVGTSMRKKGMDPDYIQPTVPGEAFRKRDAGQ